MITQFGFKILVIFVIMIRMSTRVIGQQQVFANRKWQNQNNMDSNFQPQDMVLIWFRRMVGLGLLQLKPKIMQLRPSNLEREIKSIASTIHRLIKLCSAKQRYLSEIYKIAQSYKIEVPKDIQGIHPCVLFYYANDEVEFVPPEKFK